MTDRPGDIIRLAIAHGPVGLSQKTIAGRAGISEKHLSQVVQGKARLSAELAVRIASCLAVSAEDLMIAQALCDVAEAKAAIASSPHTEGVNP